MFSCGGTDKPQETRPEPEDNKSEIINEEIKPAGIPGLFPYTSERLLEPNDLIKLKLNGLQLMRNEIYARHGYIFQSKEVADYFAKESWYTPKLNDISSQLSRIETQNIALISRFEKLIKGNLPPKEGFDFYLAMFPNVQFPFKLMTENESTYSSTIIPDYLNQTSHNFNKVVGKCLDKDSIVALIILEDIMNPPSFAPYYFNLYTFSKSGKILDSALIAYDEFDGYQSAIIGESGFEVITYQYQFGEEEGPNGLPEVDSIFKVNNAFYTINDSGKILLKSE